MASPTHLDEGDVVILAAQEKHPRCRTRSCAVGQSGEHYVRDV